MLVIIRLVSSIVNLVIIIQKVKNSLTHSTWILWNPFWNWTLRYYENGAL